MDEKPKSIWQKVGDEFSKLGHLDPDQSKALNNANVNVRDWQKQREDADRQKKKVPQE